MAAEKERAIVTVRVTPRSRRPGIGGVRNGVLLVGVSAAPEKGRATEEARRTIASWLRIAPARVALEWGAASRDKAFSVEGISPDDLRKRVLEVDAGEGPGIG